MILQRETRRTNYCDLKEFLQAKSTFGRPSFTQITIAEVAHVTRYKGGKFLKKLVLRRRESIAGNLVLTTELKT